MIRSVPARIKRDRRIADGMSRHQAGFDEFDETTPPGMSPSSNEDEPHRSEESERLVVANEAEDSSSELQIHPERSESWRSFPEDAM